MAAVDAAQRARDYAEALGMRIVKPVELVEDFAPPVFAQPHMHMAMARAPGGGAADREQEVRHVIFRAEEIEMSASVDCKFLVGMNEEDFKSKRGD